ncbi:MAG: ATP-binding cassette domain-containing protein [Candidatus Cryptobacteroides sp.]
MIRIENLAFSYGANPVLDNITMTLEDGRIYGLLGENGVGKTTLLSLLAGLKKVKAGSIETDGCNPYSRRPDLLADQFFLTDDPAPQNAEAEKWARRTGSFWPKYNHSQFLEIMAEFENDPSLKMNRMSAGLLKKTWIAFALACNVKHLFMDEPTNGLDIPSKAAFRSAVMKHTREDSVIVISTHQVRDLENVIDPIIILDRQEVLLNASLEEVASKLYFDYGSRLYEDCYYSEQLPGGFIQVRPNPDGVESKVNIEALFNAVHKHKETMKALFTR